MQALELGCPDGPEGEEGRKVGVLWGCAPEWVLVAGACCVVYSAEEDPGDSRETVLGNESR